MDIWVKGRIGALISGSNLTGSKVYRFYRFHLGIWFPCIRGHGLMTVEETTLDITPCRVGNIV
ncbi:hypothetical protein HanIR_Chr08g0345981 [Helianthus annuus]|nr:hypothetical protein HanIR_Chr08g0345981 [Helianthus annuus]